MQRFFLYAFALSLLMMMCSQLSQAAPVVPQVWLDDHGQVFAIAFEGPSDQETNIMSKQSLLDPTDEEADEDEDEMYATPSSNAVIILPNPSLKDKIVNYVNTVLISS